MARRQEVPPCCAESYYSYQDELSIYDGLTFSQGRMPFIPKALRYQTMKQLHGSHIGINGCLRRARECLFWPGMNAKIECVQHASQRGMRAMRVNVRGMRAIHASHASHCHVTT